MENSIRLIYLLFSFVGFMYKFIYSFPFKNTKLFTLSTKKSWESPYLVDLELIDETRNCRLLKWDEKSIFIRKTSV